MLFTHNCHLFLFQILVAEFLLSSGLDHGVILSLSHFFSSSSSWFFQKGSRSAQDHIQMVWQHRDPDGSHSMKTKLHRAENSFWGIKKRKMFLLKSESLFFLLYWTCPSDTWVRLLWQVASVAFSKFSP